MSVKQETTTVMQTLIVKTLKDPLCAPASQDILGMELTTQVKTVPRSSLEYFSNQIHLSRIKAKFSHKVVCCFVSKITVCSFKVNIEYRNALAYCYSLWFAVSVSDAILALYMLEIFTFLMFIIINWLRPSEPLDFLTYRSRSRALIAIRACLKV